MLSEKLNQALAEVQGTADNFYLRRMARALEEVEQAAPGKPILGTYIKELGALLETPNFALNPKATNEFAQRLGEAHFWHLCEGKGLVLERIPEQDKKTPDFASVCLPNKLHFEVKTLSVVGGDAGVSDAIEGSVDAQVEIERQLRAGKKVAFSEHVIAPYGNKEQRQRLLLHATQTLIEKVRQNVKREQFNRPNTFLILNLSMLNPVECSPRVLRPSYPSTRSPFPTAVTGQLWAAAFGRPEMFIQNTPAFEGKPCIEGNLDKLGVLSEFQEIKGIIFVVHPMSQPAQVWALFRDFEQLCDEDREVAEELVKVVGQNWNDSFDRNGYRFP